MRCRIIAPVDDLKCGDSLVIICLLLVSGLIGIRSANWTSRMQQSQPVAVRLYIVEEFPVLLIISRVPRFE